MPPEQARGATIDARADVYSLGAMLYHILAGEPPYCGESSAAVLDKVIAGPPIPVGKREPSVPPDLATIVEKATARDLTSRYTSAAALAEDLRRFQTGQLVRAHEYSSATLAWRWIIRHRSPVTVAALALIILNVMALFGLRRISHARDIANEQRAAVVAKRNELVLLQARSSLEHDPTQTLAWLKTYPLDGANWTTVQTLAAEAHSLGVARHVLPTGAVQDVAFMPDGKSFVVAGYDKKVALWDIEHERMIASVAIDAMVINVSRPMDNASRLVERRERSCSGNLRLATRACWDASPRQ
jgi:hypothetical protein